MAQTCSGCRHWHKMPAQPSNVSVDPPGECREHLHAMPMMQQTAQGLQNLGWVAG